MELRYRDIKNPNDEWTYLEVVIPEEVNPSLQLLSNNNLKFKLDGPAAPLFWGIIDEGYYGVSILRNDNEWPLEQMPVKPIQAADIEASIQYSGFERDSFWARFFAKSLSKSKASPFYKGKWSLTNKNPYIETSEYDLPVEEPTAENKAGFYNVRPLYLDWGAVGSYAVIALKSMPDKKEGRVKWWRKQVRAGNCPPVLIWFISCLQAYVVLDGHARLRAFTLEKQAPDFMVLKAINELKREPDLSRAQKVHDSLQKRQQHAYKPPMTVDEINQLLIQIYDTRPFVHHMTRSKAVKDLDQKWLEEVAEFSNQPGTVQEELEAMLE